MSDEIQNKLPLVSRDDGGITLQSKLGFFEPLYMRGGIRVESFIADWTPIHLFHGFDTFKVLTFRGPSSAIASWIISADNVRLGDKISDLSESEQNSIVSAAEDVYRRVCDLIFCERYPSLDLLLKQFMCISSSIRLEIFHRLKDNLPIISRTALINDLTDINSFPAIEASFSAPFYKIITSCSSSGAVSWPALGADNSIEVQGSLIIDDFRFCYRLFDIATEMVFFVVSSDHLSTTLGVYMPSMSLLVTDGDWSRHLLDVYFPEGVGLKIIEHFLVWGNSLCSYFRARGKRAANIMRTSNGVHMGHQLWNELSGIECYYANPTTLDTPLWIVPGKTHSVELWGNIEEIFQGQKMDVVRGISDTESITDFIYKSNLCGVRITQNFVSESLRKAVLRNVERNVEVNEYIARLQSVRPNSLVASSRSKLNIVFGLRVENRTIIEYKSFCKHFVQYVARTWPGSNIIVDGHNVICNTLDNKDVLIPSHGERMGERMLNCSPIDCEREIVSEMSSVAEKLPVDIISLIGDEIGKSLKVCSLSDVFFSIWGAGLAKYRWICNLPGFVVTSRVNLRFRDDLHIYDSPKYMESPTKVSFNNPESVEDEYSSDQLISVGAGSKFYASFHVKEEDILEEFRHFVCEHVMPLS